MRIVDSTGGEAPVIVMTACYAIETRWMQSRDRVRLIRTPVGEGAFDALDERPNEPVDLLLSTGFCGGADPALRRGDLVLADRVLHRGESILLDPALVERAQRILAVSGCKPTIGAVASSANVAQWEDKQRLLQEGALSVDMESGPLSRWAIARDVPFLSLRGVLDEAGDDVPFSPQSSLIRAVVCHPLAAARAGRWARQAGRALGRALDALVLGLEERP